MPTQYSLNAPFMLEDISVWAVNIISAPFLQAMPAHKHATGCYEIHFISAGRGTLQTEHDRYAVEPHSVFVTGPHVLHAQLPDAEEPMQEYCVYLCVESRGKLDSPVLRAFCNTRFWFGKDDGEIRSIFQRIFREFTQGRTGYLLQVKLLLSQLILWLIRSYEAEGRVIPHHACSGSASQSTFIIEECFLYEYRTLTLQALAERLQFSPRQTQRLLKNYYGSTFRQKKQEAQLSAAVAMLQDSRRHIAEISEALDFSSPEHFSNAFKKAYGMSPSRYRKQKS